MPATPHVFTSAARRCAWAYRYCARGVTSSGPERDDLLLQAKGVAAAVAAWSLANRLLPSAVWTFAPFTALLIQRVTLYKSFRDCAQYLGALLLGAGLAAGLGTTAGVHAWSLALLVLGGLLFGKLRRLGEQGAQVSVIAVFAFSAGHGDLRYIGHLLASVALGAGCGIVAHLAVAPARRTLRSQRAVEDLAGQAGQIITDLASSMAEEEVLQDDDLKDWSRRCAKVTAEAERVRAVVDTEAENARLNPRSALPQAGLILSRTYPAITVAERSVQHLHSLVRSLHHAVRHGGYEELPRTFLDAYSALLGRTAGILERVAQPTGAPDDLRDVLMEAGTLRRKLESDGHPHDIPSPGQSALCGSLITDIGRLLDEVAQARAGEPRDDVPPPVRVGAGRPSS